MINPQWLELPISRTNLHGPIDVRAIKIRLYIIHERKRNFTADKSVSLFSVRSVYVHKLLSIWVKNALNKVGVRATMDS